MAVEKIIIGRDKSDLKKFGSEGTGFIGKHIVGKGEEAHLTNPIHMDLIKPHIMLVTGKRGTGKSYSVGTFAEEIARLPDKIRKNLSVLMVDTMGIYWSMKNANERARDSLKKWDLKPQGMKLKLFVPKGYVSAYKEANVKVDSPLTLSCGEITSVDWNLTFGFSPIDAHGIAVEQVIKSVKAKHGKNYGIIDIIKQIKLEKEITKEVKEALINRFKTAEDWGVFEKKGTSIANLFFPGAISIIDVSHYMSISHGWSVKAMLVGLIARRVYQERLMARKAEEFEVMTGESSKKIPMVWIMIDEAHQFLPNEGTTAATEPLLTLIRQGREPGISLVMITQRPNKLHEDALAQSDLIISHRLTAEADIKALRGIMQTYMMEDIQDYINHLPRKPGTAIVLDDNSERIYPIQLRTRITWHAGGSPAAIKEKGLFD